MTPEWVDWEGIVALWSIRISYSPGIRKCIPARQNFPAPHMPFLPSDLVSCLCVLGRWVCTGDWERLWDKGSRGPGKGFKSGWEVGVVC